MMDDNGSVKKQTKGWLKFIVSIILPTVLVICISIITIYFFIIPAFRSSFLESKRQMIKELVNVAWSVMVLYEEQEQGGQLSREEAQRKALKEIEHLRYGREGRDYFWISDMTPRLVMHPYSKELIGSDLSTFEDAGGKRLFMDIKELLATEDSGFIDYIWNKKYTEIRDVPKLSYVKKFAPWGWVVGTGVFLDDVQQKTDEIARRLTRMVHIGVALIVLLLCIIVLRSLVLERRRSEAEEGLRRSRIKYKTLVEAAIDPIMMLHNGSCIYANQGMEDLLGYRSSELETMNLNDLVAKSVQDDESSREQWESALHGYHVGGPFESVLQHRDGRRLYTLISMTRRDLGSQKVVVVTARDVSAAKRIAEEREESRERFRRLAERFQIGMFRTTGKAGFTFVEANGITGKLLGVSEQRLLASELFDYIVDSDTRQEVEETLRHGQVIKEKTVQLRRNDHERITVSLSLAQVYDAAGDLEWCDGLLEDISRRKKTEEQRERLIVDLQTSLMFLNQPIRSSLAGFASCGLHTTIAEAAKKMNDVGCSAILVADESGEMVGIVTDLVLRERVIAGSVSADKPIYRIMSAPLIYIDDSALVFEAVLLLQEKKIKHLVVRDAAGTVTSVISNEELLDVHRYSSSFLLEQVRRAPTVADIGASLGRVPRIIKALIDCGTHAENITRVVTTISDTVLQRLVKLAIENLGDPPAPFAFISVGSEGRGEQTLVTDQDNAIVFADVPAAEHDAVKGYFERLGKLVCTWLDEVGYRFCTGNVMAMNPSWCQPLSVWKRYFSTWIAESGPEELMEVSIFFDFRCLYGIPQLTEELHHHICSKAMKQKPFFYQMAQNTLLFKVPLDFFGKLSVETGGEYPNTFNIKHVMAQVVGFARINAIFHGLESTGTLDRLDRLLEKGFVNKELHDELREAYNYLMQQRLRHQLRRMDSGAEPDNHIHISELLPIEKDMLEKLFGQINQLRKRLSQVGESEIYF